MDIFMPLKKVLEIDLQLISSFHFENFNLTLAQKPKNFYNDVTSTVQFVLFEFLKFFFMNSWNSHMKDIYEY